MPRERQWIPVHMLDHDIAIPNSVQVDSFSSPPHGVNQAPKIPTDGFP